MTLIERVAQNHRVTAVRVDLRRIEACSKSRTYAEYCKKIRRGARPFDPFRLSAARKIQVRQFESADRFELRRALLPFAKIAEGGRNTIADECPESRVLFPNHDQTIGLAIRQTAQQDRIDNAEHGRVRADSQSNH